MAPYRLSWTNAQVDLVALWLGRGGSAHFAQRLPDNRRRTRRPAQDDSDKGSPPRIQEPRPAFLEKLAEIRVQLARFASFLRG
jgi:hypothetical protein